MPDLSDPRLLRGVSTPKVGEHPVKTTKAKRSRRGTSPAMVDAAAACVPRWLPRRGGWASTGPAITAPSSTLLSVWVGCSKFCWRCGLMARSMRLDQSLLGRRFLQRWRVKATGLAC